MNIACLSHRGTLMAGLLILMLTAAVAVVAQNRQTPPPEYKELVAATNIADAAARLKEFERIKMAYPTSQFMDAIEASILVAKVELATTLDDVLALQKETIDKGRATARVQNPVVMAIQLLRHPLIGTFDKARVLAAIVAYKNEAAAALADPANYEGIPANQRDFLKTQVLNAMELSLARAYLNAGDAGQATATLEAYRKAGGPASANYEYMLGGVREMTGKLQEAYEAYLAAAVDNFEDSAARAKALYAKIKGSPDGFEAALAAKVQALPFTPEPFKAPADWKGKVVLAELFTGSECPPCVAADIGFDALIETFPEKYLAVLVYHLPIPRPDPMMNPATEARETYYDVNSTPTVVIDGVKTGSGGGNRAMAEGKFAEYRAAIEPLLSSLPATMPSVRASLAGDKVNVTFDSGEAVPEADYILALVQAVQEHKGANGVVFHKMVVRDLLKVDPKGRKSASFDLAASEKAADAYLTDFERSYTRIPNFKWAVRRCAIARSGLKVVLFVQDGSSRQVLNAAVADVK
jgi:thiol-disulfide isomerase/thioredoxin